MSEEPQTLTMRAARAVQQSESPSAPEVAVGAAMIVVGMAVGAWWIVHPGEHTHAVRPTFVWVFVGALIAGGLYMVAPVRMREIVREAKAAWREFRGRDPKPEN